jgi:hypothetical protein
MLPHDENRRMVFGDIVTIVGFSQCPFMTKLTSAFPASEQKVFCVHCFKFFHYIVVDDAKGSGVVGLHWSGKLCVAQIF